MKSDFKRIVLITKDAMPKSYLPIYGNRFWKTPNIDRMCQKGFVFDNYYCCAPSTGMSFYGMITGQEPYQTQRKNYGDELPFIGKTIFEKFNEIGYTSYLIWDESFTRFSKSHLTVLNNFVNVFSLPIKAKNSIIIPGTTLKIESNDSEADCALNLIKRCLLLLSEKKENIFVWLHLPHVFAGRMTYCSDIDILDRIVGAAIEIFGIDAVFLSSDHGNMDGKRGIFGYGFDVDQEAINIPLIVPYRKNFVNKEKIYLSNCKLFDILTENISESNYVITDSAYYTQRLRSISIIHEGYKLVYIKEKKEYKLFDISFDPNEKYNLLINAYYDVPRKKWQSLEYKFYYPHWDDVEKNKELLFKKMNEIYRTGTKWIEFINFLKNLVCSVISFFRKKHLPNSITEQFK